MTTEDKIREAFERMYGKGSWADKLPSPAQAGFMYGYVMGMAEAFEAAAVKCEQMEVRFDTRVWMYSTKEEMSCITAKAIGNAIREMAKEMK